MSTLNEEQPLRFDILFAFQIALLGEITPNIRLVTIEWGSKSITALYLFDGEICEDDVENASCVETEIMSHFPDYEIDFKIERYDFPQLLKYKFLEVNVYRRKEEYPE